MKNEIVKTFYYKGSQSIADISRGVHKSIPNVTKSVNAMVDDGILLKNGHAPSTGGRRAAHYLLNPTNCPYFITVAIDQYSASAALLDIHNNFIIKPVVIQNPLNEKSAFNNLTKLIQTIVQKANCPLSKIGNIAITIPGFVDCNTGINDSFPKQSPFYNLPHSLQKKLGIKTYIENDSSAIATAENKFGLAKESPNALVINLNWGVGLGIIVDNKLFTGHNGFAGEFSHIPLSDNNTLCSCGKKGCLEVEASLLAIIKDIKQQIDDGEISLLKDKVNKSVLKSGEAVIEAVNRGDQLAIGAVNKASYMLGKGVATLIHILNPQSIIISGRGAKLGSILLSQIHSAIFEFAIPSLAAQSEILISNSPDTMQLLGSMCLGVEQFDWEN